MAFTKENAAIYAIRGVQARKANQAKHQEAHNTMVLPATPSDDGDSYRAKRLARVRRQLDMVDSEVWKEASKNPEGKRLKELVEAQNRLDAQEWSLSNRHKPSVAKPSTKQVKPRNSYPEPEPQYSVIHDQPSTVPVPVQPKPATSQDDYAI